MWARTGVSLVPSARAAAWRSSEHALRVTSAEGSRMVTIRNVLVWLALAATLGFGQETLPPLDLSADFETQVRATAVAILDANQALLEERAALYEGPDAATHLAELRDRADDLDALLTQAASLLYELTWLHRERSMAAAEVGEVNRDAVSLHLREQRFREQEEQLAAALIQTSEAISALNAAYPEAARFVEVDSGLSLALNGFLTFPADVATPTLHPDDARALRQLEREFASIDRDIDRMRTRIQRPGWRRLGNWNLIGVGEAVLEALREQDPEAAERAEAELADWRRQRERREAWMAAGEIGLIAGAVFSGGTLSVVLGWSARIGAFTIAADQIGEAITTHRLANTHPDPHEGLASQADAQRETMDAVVLGALVAGEAALVARAALRTTRGLVGSLTGETGVGRGVTPSACFLPGTLVATPDGPRPIEELQVGDLVLSQHEGDLAQAPRRVTQVFRGVTERVISVQFAQLPRPPPALRCTPEHPFWVVGEGWVPAGRLRPGDLLLGADGTPQQILTVEARDERAPHHNLEVEGWHTYFVSGGEDQTPVWVHNACWRSVREFGHTFNRHGAGSSLTNRLRGRAGGTGQPQGQWLDNPRAAEFLEGFEGQITAPTRVELPAGMGQVIHPDGSISEATHALLVPRPGGGFRTAYPVAD